MPISKERKSIFLRRTVDILNEYSKALLVCVDNVGSCQMHRIRAAVRQHGTLLMGKNTLVRKAIMDCAETNPEFQSIMPLIIGNVGLVFTNDDLSIVADKILSLRVAAPAKSGMISPVEVVIPKGNTGLEPTKTSFLQALNIPSKINKGQVELVNDVILLSVGSKVGASECSLLSILNIKPFSYGMVILKVYDNGNVYDANVLNITDESVLDAFKLGIKNVASISLTTNYPTLASFPHMLINSYRNVLSVSIATDYTFPRAEKIKQIISDPTAYMTVQMASAIPSASDETTQPPQQQEKEDGEDEDDGDEFGLEAFNMFGD